MPTEDHQLNRILHRLASGDDTAAAAAFLEFEPLLRVIVRRQLDGRLRAKFDSLDVVQSVWADLLTGFRDGRWRFTDASQLRGFLVKATRNRFLNEVRHLRTTLDHERPWAEDTPEPADVNTERPSEAVRVEDLWQTLLAECPPQHRELLRLKREGLSLAALATRTGLHESSVRRILYDLARKFAAVNRAGGEP